MEQKQKKQNWLQKITAKLTNKIVGIIFILFAFAMFSILYQLLDIFYGFSLFEWFNSLPYIYPIASSIFQEIEALTDKGIFYIYSFGGIFIFPVPNEMIYFRLLKKFSFEHLLPLIYLGLLIAHNVNYFLGRIFGFILKLFFSKKSTEKIKNYLKRYGSPTILVFNAFPLPSPFFNFCCGMFKYPYMRWFLSAFIGQICNYIILTAIYLNFLA